MDKKLRVICHLITHCLQALEHLTRLFKIQSCEEACCWSNHFLGVLLMFGVDFAFWPGDSPVQSFFWATRLRFA